MGRAPRVGLAVKALHFGCQPDAKQGRPARLDPLSGPESQSASPRDAARTEAIRGLLARTRTDADLRTRYRLDPPRTLRENGIEAPDRIELRAVDAGRSTSYLVLPPAPTEGEVSDGDLQSANGGTIITPMVIDGIADWASG